MDDRCGNMVDRYRYGIVFETRAAEAKAVLWMSVGVVSLSADLKVIK